MRILVANLGSTSFKYKLFDLDRSNERVLAHGGADRIGQGDSAWSATSCEDASRGGKTLKGAMDLADHAAAIELHLDALTRLGVVADIEEIEAIGFKAVHGGSISGAVRVDDHVLATQDRFADVAPAHNPPYSAAMRAFAKKLPRVPQVAAFETAFHQTIPMARQVYAIPWEWTEKLGIRRYGFHGASHRYIATRMAEIAPDAKRIVNLHLGGSSSICAIQDGRSIATSMGMTPQSGLPQNNRVGDFDTFALQKLVKAGYDLDTILHKLGKEGGLLGISGVSADCRDVEAAAAEGNERAQLALDAFVESCRHYLGAYVIALGGVDAVTFTGGIGQHGKSLRERITADLAFLGIQLDKARNEQADSKAETRLEVEGSEVQIWALPTNEELIVARQTLEVLTK